MKQTIGFLLWFGAGLSADLRIVVMLQATKIYLCMFSDSHVKNIAVIWSAGVSHAMNSCCMFVD